MKFFTLPAVGAAALFSAVVAMPFHAGPKAPQTGAFALEVSMTSTRSSFVQVFYPAETGAISEASSSKLPLVQSTSPRLYRLPLPPGRFAALRFDPLSREGAVTLESVRIIRSDGGVVRAIAWSELQPGQHIDSMRESDRRLEIKTTADGDDPQVTISLTPPLDLPRPFRNRFQGFWPLSLTVFAALAGLFFCIDRAGPLRSTFAHAGQALMGCPFRAIAAVSAAAVIASAYPVIFLGKSHVSPNFGTPLLYDDVPTLPEATHTESSSAMGADVGAMMWAHLPYSMVAHRAVMGGEFPLWNRYNSLGSPLLGQGQSMIGDPLHMGVVLANGAAWAWDMKYLVAKWLFAAGLGLLVFHVTSHLPAALVVTIAAPFIGFFAYRINHAAYFSLCYAPWPLFAWLRLTQSVERRAVNVAAAGLLVANIALMNSGTVKEACLLLLAVNFSGACLLLSHEMPWKLRLAKLAAVAGAVGLGALLTAPLWSTFLHTLANAQTNYEVSAVYQIQPSLLLGAFDEAFFRLIMPGESVFNPSLNFLLLLGLLYFLATLFSQRGSRVELALAASSLLPFSLVFGIVPPSWLASVPFLGRVQHIDNCFLCALIVLWSVLAGIGFARAAARLGTSQGRADLAAVAGWLVLIVGVWIAFRQTVHRGAFGPGMTFSVLQHGQVIPVSRFVWGYLGALLLASGILALVVRRALQRQILTPGAGVVIALCAFVLLGRHGLHAETVGFQRHVVRPPVRANLHAPSPAMEFMRSEHAREPARGFGMYHNFFMGWTGTYGLEAINGPDALMNPWYRELIAVCGTQRGISWDFSLPPENLAEVRPFFDALNVRFYFTRGHDAPVLRRSLVQKQILDLDIWESPAAWPRAFFTDRLAVYDQPADFVRAIKGGDGRPFAAVQRGQLSTLPPLNPDLTGRNIAAATNYRLTENTTGFDIRASAPGVVVLSETFWPGDFRAEVNGRKVPVLRLNHAFKGVAIGSPGEYRVIFRYVPKNFPRNLLLCATGATLLAASTFLALRGRVFVLSKPPGQPEDRDLNLTCSSEHMHRSVDERPSDK